MDLQFRGHRYLDDVIANLEKRYGKPGKKTPQPITFNMVRKKQPQPARRRVALQPAPMAPRAAPAKPMLSEKEDRKRRMKKRHWYEDKFGDLSKLSKKKPRKKRSAPSNAKKNPICFNRRTTLLSLLKRIPAVKTPLATMFG